VTAPPPPAVSAMPVSVVCGWADSGARGDGGLAVAMVTAAGPGAVLLRPQLVAGDDAAVGAAGVEVYRLTEEVAERTPGCPCCAVRVDLIRALGLLARRRRPPHRVVVETLPDTDPATIAVTVLDDPELGTTVRLDGIVTAVDGSALATRLVTAPRRWPAPVALDQVLMADQLVITGCDRLTPVARTATSRFLRSLNPVAGPLRHPGGWSAASLLGLGGWSPDRVGLRLEQLRAPILLPGEGGQGATGSLRLEVAGDMREERLEEWFEELRATQGARLLRVEAVLAMSGYERRWLAVGSRTVVRFRRGRPWEAGERRGSRLRLVGRDLDLSSIATGLSACRAT
jgi:G3E family GTPase